MDSCDGTDRNEAADLRASLLESTAYQRQILICSQDGAELTIEPADDCIAWKIRNGSLASWGQIQLQIVSVRTSDDKKPAFRQADEFGFDWPPIRDLRAGRETPVAVFVRFLTNNLGLGKGDRMPNLPWPNGDRSLVRVWCLKMTVTGLSRDWSIEVLLL